MSFRRMLAATFGLVLTAVLAVALPSAAQAAGGPGSGASPMVHAYEWDIAAVDGTDGNPTVCSSVSDPTLGGTAGYSCFQPYGDKLWAKDVQGDGWSITMSWKNYLKDGKNWVLYRQGSCVNEVVADSVWRACNKDFYENGSTNHYDDKGSYIEWQTCMYNPKANIFDVCGDANALYNE